MMGRHRKASMSLVEIATCVVVFFAWWFALTPRGETPHPLWSPVAGAFAATIFSLGVAATTGDLLTTLVSTAASPADRHATMADVATRAYRPMLLSVGGLAVYVLILRSTIEPPTPHGPSLGGWASTFTLLSAIAVGMGAFAYHGGLAVEFSTAEIERWMKLTISLSMFTVVFSGCSALAALVAVSRLNRTS